MLLLNNRLGSVSFETVNRYREGFENIKAFLDFSSENWDESSLSFKQGFADMLIGMMHRYYPVTEKKDYRKNDKALFEAVKYINENCKQDIDIRALAEKFGYTENYFSAILKRFVGMSFRDYLNRCRILEYMRLRKEKTDMSTATAAEASGFGSVKSFYRAKKKFENEKTLREVNYEKKEI